MVKSTKMLFEAGNGLIPSKLLPVWTSFRAVNPPRLQILRIDRKGMIDDVISYGI